MVINNTVVKLALGHLICAAYRLDMIFKDN